MATPPLRVQDPMGVDPSRKMTCPVAVPGVTVAVKVIGCPCVAGLAEDVNVVTVVIRFTVSITATEELGAFVPFPPYDAENEY